MWLLVVCVLLLTPRAGLNGGIGGVSGVAESG